MVLALMAMRCSFKTVTAILVHVYRIVFMLLETFLIGLGQVDRKQQRRDKSKLYVHVVRTYVIALRRLFQYSVLKHTVLDRLRKGRRPIRPRRPYVGHITGRNRTLRLRLELQHQRWSRAD